jgi:hypothetical protein
VTNLAKTEVKKCERCGSSFNAQRFKVPAELFAEARGRDLWLGRGPCFLASICDPCIHQETAERKAEILRWCDSLAKWVSNRVIKTPCGNWAYPLTGAQVGFATDGSLRLLLTPDLKQPSKAQVLGPAETGEKARSRARELKETLARATAEVEQLRALASTGELAGIVHDEIETSGLIPALRDATETLQRQLFELATKDSHSAATSLAASASDSVALLDELALSKPEVVQAVARAWTVWPVHYNPRKETLRSLKADFKTLQVGTNAAQKWDTRATNLPSADKEQGQQYRDKVGSAAQATGFELMRIWTNETLRQVVADSRQKGCDDWPTWIVQVTQLPPLTKASAPRWFEAGWQMLEAVTPDGVVNIPELRPVGDGRANQARGTSTTAKEGERRRRIKEALKKAFCSRFGRK